MEDSELSTDDCSVLFSEQATKLFRLCDIDRKGFTTKEELGGLREFMPKALIDQMRDRMDEQALQFLHQNQFILLLQEILASSDEGHKIDEKFVDQKLRRMQTMTLADELAVLNNNGPQFSPKDSDSESCISPIHPVFGAHPLESPFPLSVENKTSPMSYEFERPIDIKKVHFRPLENCAQPTMLGQSLATEFSELDAAKQHTPVEREHEQQVLRTPDRIFKVVFVGDSAVGKTCFLHRFCHNRFRPLFNATIGVDFTVRTIALKDRVIALQLWDTAGQERFRSITKQYFRKADGVVLMFDVTSEQSFLNVRNWIQSVKSGVDESTVMALVGNKVDLFGSDASRTSVFRAGKALAQEFDMPFFETSAFTGFGISSCMASLAERLHRREEHELEEALRLQQFAPPPKRSWCCL